jgi:TatD DNase family protein
MLFDTHTHINVKKFDGEVEEVIERALEHDVKRMAVVGFDTDTIERALQQADKHEGIYAIIGWHPTEAGSYTDEIEKVLKEQLRHKKVVAMGEMGLDYHWMEDPKEVQEEVFRRQIRVAKELDLPISIHNRDATEDTYRILKEEDISNIGGIMHSFNLDPEWMEKFLDLGMHISFSGVVTFKNAKEVKESAKQVPLDKVLIETDAPFLAPMPNRGKRNEPSYVRYVAEEIATLKNLSIEEIAKRTTENANKLFRLDKESK